MYRLGLLCLACWLYFYQDVDGVLILLGLFFLWDD
jgi:hypothetical protein